MAAKRLTKGQIKQDKFISSVFRAQEYFAEHLMTFIGGIVAVAAVAMIIILLVSSSQSSEQEANDLLGRAGVEFRSGNFQLAAVDYQTILDQYGGSDAAKLASFYIANAYFALSNYDQAEQYFSLHLDKYRYDDMLTANAMAGRAQCLRAKGMMAEAAEAFRDTYSRYPDSYVATDCLFLGAKSFATAGDSDAALGLYELLRKIPEESTRSLELKRFLFEKGILDPTVSSFN